MIVLWTYLIIINAAGFFIMLADKRKAIKKEWRIPESTLLGVAAMGGSFGTLLAMRLFRHKTLHTKFSVGVPLLLLVHIVLLVLLQR